MKIVLFTDTIGDLNGVLCFLQDIAENAMGRGDDKTLDNDLTPLITGLPETYQKDL